MSRVCAYEIIDEAGPDAPWLTLVHGASQSRAVFAGQVPSFRSSHRLLLVDLAGHGASVDVRGPFGPIEYAEGVLGALDAAGVRQTHYWGTHTGAAVALTLATTCPARLSSLVLEGAVIPGRAIASVAECYGRAKASTRTRGLAAARAEWFERSPWFDVMRSRPDECRAAGHRAIVDAFPGAPWRSDDEPALLSLDAAVLARIDHPVLLLNGEHEVADFLPMADELEAVVPRARRVAVPDGGGFPLWEFPERVNAAVTEFLAPFDAPEES